MPMLFSLAKLSFSLENEFCRFMMFKAPVGAFFVPEYIKLYTCALFYCAYPQHDVAFVAHDDCTQGKENSYEQEIFRAYKADPKQTE